MVCLVQVPALAALLYFGATPLIVLPALAVTLLPLRQFIASPWDHRPRSAAHKYLVMWPFYTWWTFCFLFTLVALPAAFLAALTPLTLLHVVGAAAVVAAAGSYRALRPSPRIIEKQVALERLPSAFEGLRVVHLTDIHCGPFTPPRVVRQWVDKANALQPDVIVVTGDLITTGPDYIEVMAAELGRLEAPLGVYACLGNHDYFGTGGRVGPALRGHGIEVLDNRGLLLRRPGGHLYVAGVDDNWSGRDDLKRALRERPQGAPTVLLAHDPGLFPKAAAARVDLMLSGHTHGGQFAVPWMVRRFNLARLMTPFSSGLYQTDESVLYVNHGLGTSGPPIRLGARPELAVLTLMKARAQVVPLPVPAAKPIRRRQSGPVESEAFARV